MGTGRVAFKKAAQEMELDAEFNGIACICLFCGAQFKRAEAK